MLKVKGKHAKSTQARCSMWLPLMKLKQVINTACDPCFFFLGWNMMKVWWGKSRYHPQWSQSVRMSDSLGNHPSIYLSIHLNCLSLSRAAGGWSLSQHALGKRQVGHFTGKQTLQIRAGGPCWPLSDSLSGTHSDFDLYCMCSVKVKCKNGVAIISDLVCSPSDGTL